MLNSRALGLAVVVSVVFGCQPRPHGESPIRGHELGASTARGPVHSIESTPDAIESSESSGALSIGLQRQLATSAPAVTPVPEVPEEITQPDVTSPPPQNP